MQLSHLAFVVLALSTTSCIAQKAVIRYLGTDFILPHGCSSKDPVVQKLFELCLEDRKEQILCVSDRKDHQFIDTVHASGIPIWTVLKEDGYLTLLTDVANQLMVGLTRMPDGSTITIPQYSNICSAVCQSAPQLNSLHVCPHKGRLIGDSPVNELSFSRFPRINSIFGRK